MRYKLLGRSGLRVSELCLGTMTFGEDWGWGADKATSQAVFERFVTAGGNFFDSANLYTEGSSEKLLGEFLGAERDKFVVATKYTLRRRGDDPQDFNVGGNSRKALMRGVEASLKRLNTDYIDLLYLHMWDFMTPIEEVMRGLNDLVSAGKVLYVAFSDTPAWVVSHAVALAEERGWARPVALQLPYSVVSRDPERAQLPMAHYLNLSVLTWGILGGGVLTGKYSGENAEPKRYDEVSERGLALATAVGEIATAIGRSPAQVAISWVRQQQPHIIPILGARTLQQLEDNLGVLEFELSPEQLAQLDEISEFKRGFPLDFLTGDHVRNLIFGETFAHIDDPHGYRF